MLDQGNRTFIGSVVFVDIVGYSRKSVSEQIVVKDRFTDLLSDSLADIPPEQRLILDTGDGAALSFLGDPEDALFVSMNLRDMVDRAIAEAGSPQLAGIESHETDSADPPGGLPLRIGINLGPVKLVRDINGHPNIVGDGINVAQRIMSFARPGQIVVSRSFFDVVSVISEEYAKLFKYEGSRTDKHVREHEIYIVGDSAAAFKQAKAGTVDRAAATNPNSRAQRIAGIGGGTHGATPPADGRPIPFLQDRRKLTIAGAALAVLVVVLGVALIFKQPAERTTVAAADAGRISGASQASRPESPASGPVPAATDATKTADATAPVAGAPGMTSPPSATAAGVPASSAAGPSKAAAGKPDPNRVDSAKADAAKPALVEGHLVLTIQPWGDVFVNGKSIGVSPPLKLHKLSPGKYRVEVRNTSFTPFVTNIEIKPKEDVSVRHRFQ